MSYREKVVLLLMQPDNLELALDVADHIEDTKTRLEDKFWKAVEINLRGRCLDESAANSGRRWEVHVDDSRRDEKRFAISILPAGVERSDRYPYPCIQADSRSLKMGIATSGPNDDGTYLKWKPFLTGLQDVLSEAGYKSATKWWVAEKWIDDGNLEVRGVLLELARGDDYAVGKATDLWTLFKDHRTELEGIMDRINAAK